MGVVPVRPQARERVARAIFADDHPLPDDHRWEDLEDNCNKLEIYRRNADAAIEAFLAAEEIWVEYDLRQTVDAPEPERYQRLCGPWRRDDG